MSRRVAKNESDRRHVRAGRPLIAELEEEPRPYNDIKAGLPASTAVNTHPVAVQITYQTKGTFMLGTALNQLLHLVIGVELVDFEHSTFKDLEKIETVGVFPNYASAHAAWKAKA
jgi:hypothetical protein